MSTGEIFVFDRECGSNFSRWCTPFTTKGPRCISQTLHRLWRQHLVAVFNHLPLQIAIPCWPGRQELSLTGYNVCWMPQPVSSVILWSSTEAWCFPIGFRVLGYRQVFPQKMVEVILRRGNLPFGDLVGQGEPAQGSSNGLRTIHALN